MKMVIELVDEGPAREFEAAFLYAADRFYRPKEGSMGVLDPHD